MNKAIAHTGHLPPFDVRLLCAQFLGCHQFDPASHELFEEEGKVHETVKGVSFRHKLNEYAHIAGRGMLPGDERPEQAKPLEAKDAKRFLAL